MSTQKKYFPAAEFLRKKAKDAQGERFRAWKYELPDGFLEDFYVNGLVPFLKRQGQIVGVAEKTGIQYLAEWAFAHVEVYQRASEKLQLSFCQTVNTGGPEESDWQNQQIETSDWFALAEKWHENEFLDDSEVGLQQRSDLSSFAWHLISLESSKSHWKWLDMLESADYEDEGAPTMEESVAQAGDRRTT